MHVYAREHGARVLLDSRDKMNGDLKTNRLH